MTNRTYKTGVSREQMSLLPPRIEDYVGADNPVRAIEAYVVSLDLAALGFRHADRGIGVGQPPYDPEDLLKLYLYGYMNRVRSSRLLAREAQRNLEVMWLLKALRPGYRTIGDFRKENWAALKAANRNFVLFARDLQLLGGELVAIDGAFFDGNASKGSITTRKKLAEQMAALDRDIEAYGKELDANDAADAERSDDGDAGGGGGDLAQKIAALRAKRAQAQADQERLEASGETQLSRTDEDARLLSKSGQRVAGYNVQIAVDDKHKLIAESDVVNEGNDVGQLHRMAKAAKETLDVETLQAVADSGYYNGAELKACEEDGIVAYVPQPERNSRLAAQGRFTNENFAYDAAAGRYRCPAGELLQPTKQPRTNGDRLEVRYVSRKAVCDACPLRGRCVTDKQPTREILRWVHEDVLERHRTRMKNAGDMLRRRACLAEHPFGTLKCRAGYRHFLVRGFNKVRGEWSLMALCYNFTRVLSILGFESFMAALAKLMPNRACLLLCCSKAALAALRRVLEHFSAQIAPKPASCYFAR
jgi:transposase